MRAQPVTAGVLAAVVGFASSFTIVLAGLVAVGASERQASSGLLALSVGMGLVGALASWKLRQPIGIVWSTPGAALLVSTGEVDGGYRAALGAFVLAGVLTVLAGFWRPLSRWIALIPGPLASAMLAGVLLPVCFAPARSMVAEPWLTAPILVVWVVLMRFARRWAVMGALVAAIAAIAIGQPDSATDFAPAWPALSFTTPAFDFGTLVGLGVPLFIVTMASQNIAGIAVLRSFGFTPSLRPLLLATGAATAAGAPFGVHSINLSAITAALIAGPDADPLPERRWIAGVVSSVGYMVMGLGAGLATALVASAPPLVIGTVAGLALVGALTGAVAGAMSDPALRDSAIVTLAVSASGITAFGISAPFWGLATGLVFHAVTAVRPLSPD